MKQTLLSFLLSLLPIVASADAVEIDGIRYNLITKGQVAEVSGCTNNSGTIIIPETITHEDVEYTVIKICSWAFSGCSDVNNVTIPKTIKAIGEGAFLPYDLHRVSPFNIYISDLKAWCEMEYIRDNADDEYATYYDPFWSYRLFLNGTEVTNLEVPSTVKSINFYSFSGCESLETVSIPDGVANINEIAFEECPNLRSVSFSNSVTSIGKRAFAGCRKITSVNLPVSLVTIGDEAFDGCALSSVEIPNSVVSIGNRAFAGCNLSYLYIGSGVVSIGRNAFENRNNLDAIHISDIAAWCKIQFNNSNLQQYTWHLFLNDEEVTKLDIPNTVTSVSNYAFQNCISLTSVTIPNSVLSIEQSAFQDCSNLSSVTIANSVSSIGYRAFYGCEKVESISIGSSAYVIGEQAFGNCQKLKDVYCYADIAKYIGEEGFSCIFSQNMFEDSYIEYATLHVPTTSLDVYSTWVPWSNFGTIVGLTATNNYYEVTVTVNSSLGTVTYGESSLTDGSQAYNVEEGTDVALTLTPNEGYKLTSVMVDGVDKTAEVVDGVLTLSDVNADMVIAVSFGKVISSNVVEIDGLYYKLIHKGAVAELTSNPNGYSGDIVIPKTISYDGVTYPVIRIGDRAFANCYDLVSVIIPNGVVSIGYTSFLYCTGLSSLTLPSSIESIGCGAFAFSEIDGLYITDLSAWINIVYDEEDYEGMPKNPLSYSEHFYLNNEEVIDLIIPEEIIAINDHAFAGAKRIKTIQMTNNVRSIGNHAFEGCGISSIIIPNGVNSIGSNAFSGCSNLSSITIPQSVVSIGAGAFSGCSSLISIEIPSSVTSFGSGVFSRCTSLENVTVPNSAFTMDFTFS